MRNAGYFDHDRGGAETQRRKGNEPDRTKPKGLLRACYCLARAAPKKLV